MTSQGKVHEYEPEIDSLAFIDFEDDMPLDDGDARESWHIDACASIVRECDLGPSAALAFVGILRTQGEARAWSYLGEVVTAEGFDIFDSDSRFEVFPGGTPETYPGAPSPEQRMMVNQPAGLQTSVRRSDDIAKYDLELTCDACGEVLCDIEDGDALSVLVAVADEHHC